MWWNNNKPTAATEFARLFASDKKTASLPRKRRILVTGACSGVGEELCRRLLEHGEQQIETLFVHGRSLERVNSFIDSLPTQQQAFCTPAVADLSNIHEIRALTVSLIDDPPDTIVCSAGVATLPERTESKDGYEMQFAVNHLAHFTLLNGLLPTLDPTSRVVMVSSDLHRVGGQINLDDLNGEKYYHWFNNYLASKYCNVLLARELASRGISAVSCTPGTTDTSIDRYLSPLLRCLFRYCGPGLMAKSVGQGASCVAFCMVGDVTPGGFYSDCELQVVSGPEVQKELWATSEVLAAKALKRPEHNEPKLVPRLEKLEGQVIRGIPRVLAERLQDALEHRDGRRNECVHGTSMSGSRAALLRNQALT